MKPQTLYSVFGILACLVLALNFASALTLAGTSPTTVSALPGQSITFNFNLTSLPADVGYTAMSWALSSTTNGATWLVLPSVTSIANSSTLPLSAVLSVPAYAVPGQLTATIILKNGSDAAIASLPLTINVNQTATLSITQLTALSPSQNATLNITNTGNIALNNIGITSTGDFPVNLSDSVINLLPGQSKIINVSSNSLNGLKLGTNTVTVQAVSALASASLAVPVQGSFCKYGKVGTDLNIESITDRSALIKNNWEWKPLDQVTVEVKVSNQDGTGDKDVVVKLVFVNQDTGKQVSDFVVDDTDLEQDASINEGSSQRVLFDFQISNDVNAGSNYALYAKVYKDGSENKQCESDVAEVGSPVSITIKKDSYNVLVKSVDAPTTSSCDSTVQVTAKAYNIGSKDEDKVKVTLYNAELGISQSQEITDLLSGDSESVSFSFPVPVDAAEKQYKFALSTDFNYDSNTDTYKKESASSDDFYYYLTVLGNCQKPSQAAVSASLNSVSKVGTNLVVQVSVKNTGKNTTDYLIKPTNFDSWAQMVSIEPSTLNIPAGTTKQATITLMPTKAGSQTFNIDAVYNGQTQETEVAVNVAESSNFLTGAFSGLGNFGNNGLYIVAIVFALLIIIIIILIVRVSKKPSRFSEY